MLFAFAVLISLIFHILIIFSIYYPGNYLSLPLTAGMIFSWLYTSAAIKDIGAAQKEFSFNFFLSKLHPLHSYGLIFLLLYALFNFVKTFTTDNGTGWVDFDPGYHKLRGISGFWLLFYALGLTASYLKVVLFKGEQKE